MNLILGFLAKLFGGIFSDWLEEMRKMDEAEKKGAAEQELKHEEADAKVISEAAVARDDVRARTSSGNGLRDFATSDPNNRDNTE